MHQRSRFPTDSNDRFTSYKHGGGFSRVHSKQFYAPQPPPPPPGLPHQQHQKEILLAAGRLAAEYLVSKGKLSPSVLSSGYSGRVTGFSDMKTPAQELPPPAFLDDHHSFGSHRDVNSGPDRRRFNDDYEYDYSRSNRNGLNGSRVKRKFSYYIKREYSDWGRSRDRNGPGERDRGYSNSLDDDGDEGGAPGFCQERSSTEVGSTASRLPPKVETVGDTELEDTCSKSGSSNTRKGGPADMGSVVSAKNDADCNKMPSLLDAVENDVAIKKRENDCVKLLDSSAEEIAVAKGSVCENKQNKFTEVSHVTDDVANNKAVASENRKKEHVQAVSLLDDEITSVENNDLCSNMDVKGKYGTQMETNDLVEASHDKPVDAERNARSDCADLMKFCSFGPVPKKSRSVVHRSTVLQGQHVIGTSCGIDLAVCRGSDEMVIEEASKMSFLNGQQTENKDEANCDEKINTVYASSNLGDSFATQEEETVASVLGTREEQCDPQLCAAEVHEEVQSTVRVEAQEQYDGTVVISLADAEKPIGDSAVHIILDEAVASEDPMQLDHPASKILDLNIAGTPEITEIPDDPDGGQHVPDQQLSMDPVRSKEIGFNQSVLTTKRLEAADTPNDDDRIGQSAPAGLLMSCLKQELPELTPSASTDTEAYQYDQALVDDKVVQVINIADSPVEADSFDLSKPKENTSYQALDSMMNQEQHAAVISSIPDGYALDFLGSDMPCYPSMQADLQAGMGLNVPQGIPPMDDPIYESLGDIGFMGVWDDQPAQEYEKFF